MKILHYVSNFLPQSETFTYDLIVNLENHHIENYIVAHTRECKKEMPFSKIKLFSNDISIFKKVYYKVFKPYHLRNEKEFVHYVKILKPDLIHAHFGNNGLRIFNLFKKNTINIPLVVSFHGIDINVLPKKDKRYLTSLIKMSHNKNVNFTSPSNFLKNKISQLGIDAKKITVIPNAHNEVFGKVEKKYFWQYGDELKLINVGRFEEVKGQKYLILAFKKIEEYYPNCKLTLIGYGSLMKDMKKLVFQLRLDEKVVFLNKVEHAKLPEILVGQDIYFQPSIVANDGAEENLSVSTIEAQVVGLSAIVSNIGGLKEVVVDKKSGYLVEEKNEDKIYEMVKLYIDNPYLLKEHSKNARKICKNKFDKELIISKWIDLYRSSLQQDDKNI